MVDDCNQRKINRDFRKAGNLHFMHQENYEENIKKQIQQLVVLDCYYSKLISIYNGYYSGSAFKITRTILKFLEWSAHGVPWLVYVPIMIYQTKGEMREFYINLLIALLFDLIVIGACKLAFRRPRPCYNENDLHLSASKIDNYSFPSGHATRAFMLLILYSIEAQTTLNYLLIWAFVVGLSRIMLGRHHISDVLAGIFVGVLDAIIVVKYLSFSVAENNFYIFS